MTETRNLAVTLLATNEVDTKLLEKKLSHLTEDDLKQIESIIHECSQYLNDKQIPAISHDTYEQLFHCIFARLVYDLKPEVIRANLPHMTKLLSFAAACDKHYENGVAYRISLVLAEFFTNPRVSTLWWDMEPAKLKALLNTIWYRESESFASKNIMPVSRWSPRGVTTTVTGSVAHLNIVTPDDIERLRRSSIGMMFRGSYVREQFPYYASADHDYVLLYPDQVIQKMHGVCAADTKAGWLLSDFLQSDRTIVEVEEACFFIDQISSTPTAHWWRILTALRATSGAPVSENFSRAPEQVRTQAAALITVMAGIGTALDTHMGMIPGVGVTIWDQDDASDTWHLEDIRLVQFICDHPERAADVANFVIARGTLDFETVSAVINHVSPALSEGVL